MSPGGPTGPEGHGDSDPPERSLRKDGSLMQERSLRVSSSEDSILLQGCREDGRGRGERRRDGGGERDVEHWGGGEGKKVKRREEERRIEGEEKRESFS